MSRIPDEVIEQIRDSVDVVALIGEGVELKRTGSDFRGPCPFHGGTHRNFSVSPKRGSFYCFVCHESGDVFSYLMKRFGLDYPSALREAARRSGIVIPEGTTGAGADPREPLFETLAAAQDWYSRQLLEEPKASVARDYLGSRGIALTTAGELGLGFAPPGPALVSAMQSLGISIERLLEAGLLVRRDDDSLVPRFRSRLLFPICDLRGRVVGFGGRVLGSGEPKYLNSPETPVFRKGGLLYNLHIAKNSIRKEDSAVLVEGYFDVLGLALAGIENVVAPLGTSMTLEQAALLARYSKNVTLLYDSDQAGLRATFRSGDELLRQGLRVNVATMPLGEDPDSLVRKGGVSAIQPILLDAIDVMERKLQLLAEHGWLEGIEHRRSALDKLLPTIRAAKEPVTRDLYVDIVSSRTGVSRETIAAEVKFVPTVRISAPQSGVVSRSRDVAESRIDPWKDPGTRAERDMIFVLLDSTTWLERARDEIKLEWFRTTEFSEIFSALMSGQAEESSTSNLEGLSARAKVAVNLLMNREAFTGVNCDEIYVAVCSSLQARPLFETLSQHKADLGNRSLRETRDEILAGIARVCEELRTIYPADWKRHVLRKGFTKGMVPALREADNGVAAQKTAHRNVS